MIVRTLLPALAILAACPPPESPLSDRPVTLTLVAMNDFHGALHEIPSAADRTRAEGGLPWIAGALAALRQEDPDLVLLHAGDAFQGSWEVNRTRGRAAIEALNLLRVDATTVGNHDFDYGGTAGGHPTRDALYTGVAASEFPWLSANVVTGTGTWDESGILPWTLIERKGVQIGVVGVTTLETPQSTAPRNVADLYFLDPASAVQDVLPAMRGAGADVVVVLAHLDGECAPEPPGWAEPAPTCALDGELGAFLATLPPGSVDVVIAGHSHALIANRVGDVFVLENRVSGRMLGRLDLLVGPDGPMPDGSVLHPPWPLIHDRVEPGCGGGTFPGEARDLGGRPVAPDPAALALLERVAGEAGSLCEALGCADTKLLRDKRAESTVGDLVADALRAAFTDADLAVANAGGLRADLPAGPIRREHVFSLMPFDNRLLAVEMTGAQVRMMLRIGSSGKDGLLQVSGASYAFDPSRTGGSDLDGDGEVEDWERDRLCDVRVGGEPLDPVRTYRVVVADFLHDGGDHLGPAFTGTRVLGEGPLVRDAIEAWVKAAPACLSSAILDPANPRIATTCPAE